MTPESHRIRIAENIIWYDIWKGVSSQRLRDDDIDEYLLEDLENANLTTAEIKNYSWIVNTEAEGHNADDIENFRKLLLRYGLPSTNFGVIFIAHIDTSTLPYPAVCLTDKMIYNSRWYSHLQKQNIDWFNLSMTADFTVLMRRISVSRCVLAKSLLEQFDETKMIITLGTNPGTDANQYKDDIHPYSYPMVVDIDVVNEEQHNPGHELFYNAPAQIVVESSDQTDVGVWRSIFITEKSYKVFAWHQFPIWYAVPGVVANLRDAGFDCFDDIIDHSYDQEQDPHKRMTSVIKEMKKLIGQDLILLRKKYWQRLESNASHVQKIHTIAHREHATKIPQVRNEIQQLHQPAIGT